MVDGSIQEGCVQVPAQALENRLAEKEALLANLEAEIRVMHITIAHVRAEIEWLRLAQTEICATDSIAIVQPDLFLECVQRTALHRNPMEMLRPEFKGMKLADIIERVLDTSEEPLTSTELCRLLYDAQSKEEFERARNSLSAELRSGAKGDEPRWRKIGRNAYTAIT